MNKIELLSIPELAKKIDIPYSTATRYVKSFPEFFMFSYVDGTKKFSADQAEVLRRVYELYRQGKRTKEIKGILENEVAQDVDISSNEPSSATNDIASSVPQQAEILQAFMDKVEGMTTAFNRVANQLERQNSILEALPGVTTNLSPQELPEKEAVEVKKATPAKVKVADVDDPDKTPELECVKALDSKIQRTKVSSTNDLETLLENEPPRKNNLAEYGAWLDQVIIEVKEANPGKNWKQLADVINEYGVKKQTGHKLWDGGQLSRRYKKVTGK